MTHEAPRPGTTPPDQAPQHELTSKSRFYERLDKRWSQGLFVCVGLDSEYARIPDSLKVGSMEQDMFWFNHEIIDATHDLALAYKPNSAFYEGADVDGGTEGVRALMRTVGYVKDRYPEVQVIFDAKRADIGNTNRGYVKAAFDDLRADAITVHPTMGSAFFKEGKVTLEAMAPFLEREDKGIIVVVKTSNPSAGEFQDLPIDLAKLSREYKSKFGDLDELREIADVFYKEKDAERKEKGEEPLTEEEKTVRLYQAEAFRISRFWNVNNNVGVVVGATAPKELEFVRRIVGGMPILLPGVGTQGADVRATVRAGKDSNNKGMIINSSSGIIFKSNGQDFAEAARKETERLTAEINTYRLAA